MQRSFVFLTTLKRTSAHAEAYFSRLAGFAALFAAAQPAVSTLGHDVEHGQMLKRDQT